MFKHNTTRLSPEHWARTVMPICEKCAKWPLLAGSCPVCTSADRLLAAIANPRIPPTYEAEAKVTKVLDSAFYSIQRLVPEDDSPQKGVETPSPKERVKASKGEGSPKKSGREKEEKADEAAEEREQGRREPVEQPIVSPYLPTKEEVEERGKTTEAEAKSPEERKPLPRRREEERSTRGRSRTPKRRNEKEKKRERRRKADSSDVSGSEVRKKKRETHTSQKEKEEKSEPTSPKAALVEREPYLRPRPTQRKKRSPHTPDRPPPSLTSRSKGGGKEKQKGSGWRGRIPYSSHPRWTQGTNKGVTKRAKQELRDRGSHGRGGRYRW